jgi:NAD(P)-dependent dehydrogenase (short-subunit alcohol dehydrogenase family)
VIEFGLRGKRAVVSGAGYIATRAGHGRSSALTLAEAGASVACVDIDNGRAREVVGEIESAGALIERLTTRRSRSLDRSQWSALSSVLFDAGAADGVSALVMRLRSSFRRPGQGCQNEPLLGAKLGFELQPVK